MEKEQKNKKELQGRLFDILNIIKTPRSTRSDVCVYVVDA